MNGMNKDLIQVFKEGCLTVPGKRPSLYINLVALYQRGHDSTAEIKSVESLGTAVKQVEQKTTAESVASLPLDPQEYLKLYEPRLKGIPHTAPIYDDLIQPKEAPKTYCVSWRRDEVDHCQCYTQQITKVSMSYQACKNVVNHRMWDPTLKTATYDAKGNMKDG